MKERGMQKDKDTNERKDNAFKIVAESREREGEGATPWSSG